MIQKAKIFQIPLFVALTLLISGCGFYEEKNPKKDVASGPPSEPTAPLDKATFSWVQENILKISCIRCHSGPAPSMGIDFSSYDLVMGSGTVVAGKPEESPLWIQIQSGKMPKNGPKLSQDQIQAVYDWIKKGALK